MPRLVPVLLALLLSLSFAVPALAAPSNDDIDWEEHGVVSSLRWESPQFGTTVAWTREWKVYEDLGWTSSDPDLHSDLVSIWRDDITLSITVTAYDTSRILDLEATMAGFLEGVDETIGGVTVEDRGADELTAWAWYYWETAEGEAIASLSEMRIHDSDLGLYTTIVLTAPVEDLITALEMALADVGIDGYLIYDTWSIDEEG